MKNPQTLKRELKKLREIVETSKDPAEVWVAYSLETAIRWATGETRGWDRPHQEVPIITNLLKRGL